MPESNLSIHSMDKSEKLGFLRGIIQNTILSIQKHKRLELIGSNEVNVGITQLETLYANTFQDIPIEVLRDDILKIIRVFGTKRFDEFLSIYFLKDKSSFEIIRKHVRFSLLSSYFHPTSFNEVAWKKPNEPDTITKNKLIEDSVICEKSNQFECFDLSRSSSDFFIKVYGMKIAIHDVAHKKTIIISGMTDDILVKCSENKYICDFLSLLETNKPDSDDFKIEAFSRFKSNLTLRDLLVYSQSELYSRFMGFMNQVILIKQKSISQIVNEFITLELYAQRTMLMQLLLKSDNQEYQYLSYLLYDLLSNDANSSNIDSFEQVRLYDSLPWYSKRFFKDAMNKTIQYTNDLSNYDTSQIPIEQQICLMKADESVKEKAMVKLKELKSKGEDNGSKARQYLDGLLKIPFGVYKKEPILYASDEIFALYIGILKMITDNGYTCSNYNNEKQNNNIVSISNFLIYLKKEFLPTCEHEFVNEFKKLYSSMKRDVLIYNICFINNLIKTNKLKHRKLIHSGKKSSFMKQEIYDFINTFHNEKSIVNEMAAKNNFKTLITRDLFDTNIQKITNKINDVNSYMNNVRSILDESVYGHDRAKRQIERIIGQWINGEQSGYSFGFEGPPGVGKTSLAKKGIANCLLDENDVARPFSFIAIGGQDNGSCLNGHNYTYVGSEWGKFADVLMKHKCMNPIIFIDELDKVSKTEHGKEIIGILTHMIDSTQNDSFQDKYFNGIDLDFSKALFIFSYNDASSIDKILLDRIHRVKFDHLSMEDKLVITFKHVLPEIFEKMGVGTNTIEFNNDNITYIVENYTVEPGIRKLKEVLFEIIGELNIQFLQNSADSESIVELPIKISNEDIKNIYLKDRHEYMPTLIPNESRSGVMNGLWANALGRGGIIPIEVVMHPSSTFLELKLTGLQGDVMKESMFVAKTLAWSLLGEDVMKKKIEYFNETKMQGIHVHCPEGATPKDGPSAGTAITVAMHSVFTKRIIKKTLAITGEINLQGNVTAIGGLDLKVLGGIRAGVKEFIFPEDNKKDYHDLMEKYKDSNLFEGITFHHCSHITQVLKLVYED